MKPTNFDNRLHIGNIIRNALVFNFKRWQRNDMNTDSLLETVARLFALLRERRTEYVLVGGIALLQYVEGRNTEDIDLIMTLPSLDNLPEIQIVDRNPDFLRGKFGGLQIDILLTTNPLFDLIRHQHITIRRFVEQEIPCATVEGLLLLKMYALPSLYRQGNFARVSLYETDIATLIHDYKPQLEPLFNELSHYLSDTDLAAIKEIVAEIQQRIERFQKSSGEIQ